MPTPPKGRFDHSGLRQAREATGLTVRQLAERLGTNPEVVQLWEDGKAVPAVGNLLRVTKALGLVISDLYELEAPEGATLTDLRVTAGLSQRGFARKIGVSQTLVSQYERAKEPFNWAYLAAYAQALGVEAGVVQRAVEATGRHHGVSQAPPALEPSDFHTSAASPHLVIELEDADSTLAVLRSPQSPRLALPLRTGVLSVAEEAVIAEHLGAGPARRFNHAQIRTSTGTVRWQLAMHDHKNRAGAANDAADSAHTALLDGKLVIIVEPTDPLWWIAQQLTPGQTAFLWPSNAKDHALVPVARASTGELNLGTEPAARPLAGLGLPPEAHQQRLAELAHTLDAAIPVPAARRRKNAPATNPLPALETSLVAQLAVRNRD